MAKRFTDTDKWKKPFIRSLQAPYKLLWFYILDDCNHAGIWEVDMEVASIRIGSIVTESEALKFFGDRVQVISENKWFLSDFTFFQYGDLNEKNRLHLSVIQILNKYAIKPLRSPLEGAKDKVKDKDKDKDKDKEGAAKIYLLPEMLKKFISVNPKYLPDQQKDFKPLFSIANFLADHGKITDPIADPGPILQTWGVLCEVIRDDNFYHQKTLSTISNHIQEIIQIGRNGKQSKANGKVATGGAVNSRSAFDKIDRMPDKNGAARSKDGSQNGTHGDRQ